MFWGYVEKSKPLGCEGSLDLQDAQGYVCLRWDIPNLNSSKIPFRAHVVGGSDESESHR